MTFESLIIKHKVVLFCLVTKKYYALLHNGSSVLFIFQALRRCDFSIVHFSALRYTSLNYDCPFISIKIVRSL